jgi:hypothetical protein
MATMGMAQTKSHSRKPQNYGKNVSKYSYKTQYNIDSLAFHNNLHVVLIVRQFFTSNTNVHELMLVTYLVNLITRVLI